MGWVGLDWVTKMDPLITLNRTPTTNPQRPNVRKVTDTNKSTAGHDESKECSVMPLQCMYTPADTRAAIVVESRHPSPPLPRSQNGPAAATSLKTQ